MTQGKVMEGVFGMSPLNHEHSKSLQDIAINKPSGISSAQVIRDLQHHFNPSKLFAPWISTEKWKRAQENHNQRKRRREKQVQVKIGHGGTLDPLATGVLITGVGKGTKSLQDFLLCTKTYEAVVLFGTSTDSYDRVGKVLKRAPYEHVTREIVEEGLKQFRGRFMQLPPLFSALKMNGKPLYEYAREGKPIPKEIERRQVEVTELEILEWMEGGSHCHQAPTEDAEYAEINLANNLWQQEGVLPARKTTDSDEALDDFERKKRKLNDAQDDLVSEKPPSKHPKSVSSQDTMMSGGLPLPTSDHSPAPEVKREELATVRGPPAVRLRMTVTSGFYVRSLAHDLGAAVGSAALMAELDRTRQAEFELGKNVLEYSDLAKGEEVWGPKVEAMLDEWCEKETTLRNGGQSSNSDGNLSSEQAAKVDAP
jgi:tRNA pseudouridine55 synthase